MATAASASTSLPGEPTLHASTAAAAKPSTRPPRLTPPTRLLPDFRAYTVRADSFLLRLNKLCTTVAGLDSLLATVNYTCYLLAYLETRTDYTKRLGSLLNRVPSHTLASAKSIAPPTPPPDTSSSTLYLLASLLTETRTTLRLVALLPLYTQLRSLSIPSTSIAPSDRLLFLLNLTSCLSYIVYQVTENIAHLADHRMFLPTLTTLIPQQHIIATSPGTSPLWYLSNRLWWLGETFDVLRGLRAIYVEYKRNQSNSLGKGKTDRSISEQAAVGKQMRSDLLIASCWWPLTLHWSMHDGLRGVNDGVIGLLGTLASWEVLKNNWTAIAAEEMQGAKAKGKEGELIEEKVKDD